MNMTLTNHLLHTSLTITFRGRTEVIEHLVVDTGAAQSIISSDAVFELGIYATGCEILTMYGIGGEDYAFRKAVDQVQFGTFEARQFPLDFGCLEESYGINGIIGLDIILAGGFVIDLESIEIYQK